MAPLPPTPFRWHDGDRLIVFGRGSVADAPATLGASDSYVLLTTERAAAAAPGVVAGASAVHHVGTGRVDELAASLRGSVTGSLVVALGGGRVIDVAKALAAADPPRRVAAIPTTLSGAEMTPVHRHAAGVPETTPRVRPAVVINDPALSASQPLPELAASAGNALGHAAEGPLTPLGSPVASLAALEAARQLAAGLAGVDEPEVEEPDRDALALGALLAGYVIGTSWYGLHHVLSQTLVRLAGVGHGQANTAMLRVTVDALGRRNPEWVGGRLAEALGCEPVVFAERLGRLAGAVRLRDLGVSGSALDDCARAASARTELDLTPPRASADEIRSLYEAAF